MLKIQTVEKRAADLSQRKSVRDAWDFLNAQVKEHERAIRLIEEMRSLLEDQAVLDGAGVMVPGVPRELPPNRDLYIQLHGMEAWLRDVRFSKPKARFAWT